MKSTTQTRKKWDQSYKDRHPERIIASAKAFREKHKKKERARSRAKYLRYKREQPGIFKKWWDKFATTPKGRFKSYKQNARARKIVFEISLEEFMEYWQKPCYYCGLEIKTIGIDRIDSKKGYMKGNLRACCHKDNYAKRNWESEDFIQQCNKVARQHPRKL